MWRVAWVFLICGGLLAQEPPSIQLKPYGFIKLESILDQHAVFQGDWMLFVPSPTNNPGYGDGVFTMNARHSRIGVRIGGPSFGVGGKITGLIEMDFAGGFPNSSTAARQAVPRLRHAWIELAKDNWAVRMGQDWALIAGPFPNTTSFVVGAGKGNLWMRFPQIAFSVKKGGFKAAASINRPMAGNVKYNSFNGGDFDVVGDGERTGRPWFMGRLWLEGKKAGVSVMGHVGWEKGVDANDATIRYPSTTSYSAALEARLTTGPVAWTAKGFTGKNLNTFLGGIFLGCYPLDGKIIGVRSQGFWGQAKVKLNAVCSATVGGGWEEPKKEDLRINDRSKNQWFFLNLSRSVSKNVTLMVEAEYLQTDYIGDWESGKNWRGMFVSLFTF